MPTAIRRTSRRTTRGRARRAWVSDCSGISAKPGGPGDRGRGTVRPSQIPTPNPRSPRPCRVALNTAAPMAARLIDALFAVVYLRLLGRSDVGAYTFLVVFTTYLDTLVDFGLNALLAREVPRSPWSASLALRSVSLLRVALWQIGRASCR